LLGVKRGMGTRSRARDTQYMRRTELHTMRNGLLKGRCG
jgi:hypothetical protein